MAGTSRWMRLLSVTRAQAGGLFRLRKPPCPWRYSQAGRMGVSAITAVNALCWFTALAVGCLIAPGVALTWPGQCIGRSAAGSARVPASSSSSPRVPGARPVLTRRLVPSLTRSLCALPGRSRSGCPRQLVGAAAGKVVNEERRKGPHDGAEAVCVR